MIALRFIEKNYELNNSEDFAMLLSSMHFLGEDNLPADPAVWEDWLDSVKDVLESKVDPTLRITKE